jgi:hypothetical protein
MGSLFKKPKMPDIPKPPPPPAPPARIETLLGLHKPMRPKKKGRATTAVVKHGDLEPLMTDIHKRGMFG